MSIFLTNTGNEGIMTKYDILPTVLAFEIVGIFDIVIGFLLKKI